MAGSWIDDRLWAAAGQDFNPDSAIYKQWRQLRSEGVALGVPITPEIDTPVGVQQGFSGGYVIVWTAESGATLANDP
jgi:uncharacterized protein with LGFP repeats